MDLADAVVISAEIPAVSVEIPGDMVGIGVVVVISGIETVDRVISEIEAGVDMVVDLEEGEAGVTKVVEVVTKEEIWVEAEVDSGIEVEALVVIIIEFIRIFKS